MPLGPRANVGQEQEHAEKTGRREGGQGKEGPEISRKGHMDIP